MTTKTFDEIVKLVQDHGATVKSKTSIKDQTALYGLYKYINNPTTEPTKNSLFTAPSVRAKNDAWKKVYDRKISLDDAKGEYVEVGTQVLIQIGVI